MNGGRLFRVNDTAYSFFVCLEIKTRECLSRSFSSQPPSKQSVMESIVKDKDVLFSRAMAAETESPGISTELLWHVVELWLTIGGFSAAGAWIECHKQCNTHHKGQSQKGTQTERTD